MDPQVNFFKSELTGLPYSDSDTELTITTGDGAKLPDPSVDGEFNLVIWDRDLGGPADDPNVEIVRVTAINSDTLTVKRGQEDTTASAKSSDSVYEVILAVTKKTMDTLVVSRVNTIGDLSNEKRREVNSYTIVMGYHEHGDCGGGEFFIGMSDRMPPSIIQADIQLPMV